MQSTTSYDPWGTSQTALADSFGFTGELHDGDLVHLRARWYHPSTGTFTSRDPFAGFDTQPYSLHPYQYAYSNPVLLTDPSGELVPALIAAVALGIAAHAWLSNPSPVNAPAPGEPTVPSDHHAADLAFLETAPGTGDFNDAVATVTGRSFSGEPQNRALSAASALPFIDLKPVRRVMDMCIGEGRIAIDELIRIRGLRQGFDHDAWWTHKGGEVLNPTDPRYPSSPFPVHKQPDADTCMPTCARMAGVPDNIVQQLETVARTNNPPGLSFAQLETELRPHGWQVTISPEQGASQALPAMERELNAGRTVIARVVDVQFGVVNDHAVLVRSITSTGTDWIITVNDPATGKVILLNRAAWVETQSYSLNQYAVLHQ